MRTGSAIGRGRDVVCMRHGDTYGRDSFGVASYSKPAAVLHQLRGLLGDETFFKAFKRYAKDWAFKHPYPYDFFHTFSDVSGRDLGSYFRTWLFEAWQLEHSIAKVEIKGRRTVVTIEDLGRAVHPCTVEIKLENGNKLRQTVPMKTWWKGRSAKLTFKGKAVDVKIDPDLQTLDADRGNNRWRESEGR